MNTARDVTQLLCLWSGGDRAALESLTDHAHIRQAPKRRAGLSIEETAEVMKISPATVKRDWAMAKAWLYREMSV